MATPRIRKRPDIIKVGPSVVLVDRDYVSAEWGLSRKTIHRLFTEKWHLPSIRIGQNTYYNKVALEKVLYAITRVDGSQEARYEDFLSPETLETLSDPTDPLHAEQALAGLASSRGDAKSLELRIRALSKTLHGRSPSMLDGRDGPPGTDKEKPSP